jgi:hypothetical protein
MQHVTAIDCSTEIAGELLSIVVAIAVGLSAAGALATWREWRRIRRRYREELERIRRDYL